MLKRDLILGTAGHIDHGKTSLVKALTGVDCDRLPEEKARGITIDLGFANLDLPGFRIGIVDVPGHEKFIKNMLAGATGFDIALIIIAADDSVMPQTREHLEILKFLKIKHAIVALTKCDLGDSDTLEVVEMEIRELLEGSFFENAPIIQTSATTGKGITELKNKIAEICSGIEAKKTQQFFRLPIDRSFAIHGYGAVVTGTVYSGIVNEGDELELFPQKKMVRVRSLQSHAKNVKSSTEGQRCAINLAGIDHHEVVRGQELATPGSLFPAKIISVLLHCAKDRKKPLKHRLPVRLHLGTSEILGTLSILEDDTIAPGKPGLAQLFLKEPVTGSWGQPFVIRNSSATATLGGGNIIQPFAGKIRRRHSHSIEMLNNLASGTDILKLKAAAWFAGFKGINEESLPLLTGIDSSAIKEQLKVGLADRVLFEINTSTGKKKLIDNQLITDLKTKTITILESLHLENPLLSTHERQLITMELAYVGDDQLVQDLIDLMIEKKILTGNKRRIGLTAFKPKLSNNQRKILEKIHTAYQEAKFAPPTMEDFINHLGGQKIQLQELFNLCVLEGKLVFLQENLYLDYEAEHEMRCTVSNALENGKGMTVAEIRDLLKTSRKYAVPFCEHLDKIGTTRRDGDLRFLPLKQLNSQQENLDHDQ